jgi:hypothetical protein
VLRRVTELRSESRAAGGLIIDRIAQSAGVAPGSVDMDRC